MTTATLSPKFQIVTPSAIRKVVDEPDHFFEETSIFR